MRWNWQQQDWPHFTYDPAPMEPLERQFLLQSGELNGVLRHVNAEEQDGLKIELIGDEALKTSQIEGEMLDRQSVQASLRQQFGFDTDTDERRLPQKERGIAQMMTDLYRTFATPLTRSTLFGWHENLMVGERDLEVIGNYRQHADKMQIVSGGHGRQKIPFEAPPSAGVRSEMARFITWFNATAPGKQAELPPLARAGIAHLYFESIHPFEDGNGRIGRALCERTLAQSLGQPTLIALAYTIERNRKAYYAMLEASNKELVVTDWLVWFAEITLEAQRVTLRRIEFTIAKTLFLDRFRGLFNERQNKVIMRMFQEGVNGFKGGLSAINYITITGASRATATRDLQDLVTKGALTRTGARRYARYRLALDK